MSTFQEMMMGLQMLQQGVSQAATGYAINQAQSAVADINQNITDEGQKRQQLQGLANNLALRLTGAGASGTQIQAAFNAIDPQKFGSIEQLGIEAGLQNNQGLKDMERTLQKTNYKDWRQKGQQLHDWETEKLMEKERFDFAASMSKKENPMFKQRIPLYDFQMTPEGQIDPNKYIEASSEELTNHRKKVATIMKLGESVKSYDAFVEKHGTESMNLPGVRQKAAEARAAFMNTILEAKEKYNLGVLQEIDKKALEEMIPNAADWYSGESQAKMRVWKRILGEGVKAEAASLGRVVSDESLQKLGLKMTPDQEKKKGALPASKQERAKQFMRKSTSGATKYFPGIF